MVRAGLLAAAVLVSAGCRDWDALSSSYGESDAAQDTDAARDSGAVPSPCPSGRGSEMVRVSYLPDASNSPIDLCVDATEATRAHYAEFLSSVGTDTSGQPPECDWNDSFLASGLEPLEAPVAMVDNCDARAFCQWAGKRLCGAVNGKPDWAYSDPLENEWYFACSKGGSFQWPYGNVPQAGYCAFRDSTSGTLRVSAAADCEGGFAGLFDMTGNVWEWIDGCSSEPDAGSSACLIQGGSYLSIYDEYNCGAIFGANAKMRAPDVGIRCCASLE
jgi:formylglycine-generating enzyme required for sulfatase activity